MATTAKPIDVKTLGLTWDLFRTLVDTESDYEVFIQDILDANKEDVLFEIGASVYDDPTKAVDVVNIEKYLANAELLRRRSIIIKGQAIPDGPNGSAELDSAKDYEAKVLRLIGRLTSGDALSASVQKSNHFGLVIGRRKDIFFLK